MIRCKIHKLLLSTICFTLAVSLSPIPADARLHGVFKLLTKSPIKPPPRPPKSSTRPPFEHPRTPPPLWKEMRAPGSVELSSEVAAERTRMRIKKAAEEAAVSPTIAEREAARLDLRSFIESRWREAQPRGSTEPPLDAQVRISIEARGLSREEFDAIRRRVGDVFREPAAQPPTDRLQLTEVNLKDAYIVLVDPVRQRNYVVGFKLLKRAIEGALIISVSKRLGVGEILDQSLKCGEEDIDAAGEVCEFLALIGGIIDLAWWDNIGSETVPTEVVLDPVKGRTSAPNG